MPAFLGIRLSSASCRLNAPEWTSVLDVHVARAADDQGLTLAGNHNSDPCGLFGPPSALQVLEGSDVVYLDVLMRAT